MTPKRFAIGALEQGIDFHVDEVIAEINQPQRRHQRITPTDSIDDWVEAILTSARIGFRYTKLAEQIDGFLHPPAFIIPHEWSPKVVIQTFDDARPGGNDERAVCLENSDFLDEWKLCTCPIAVVACIGTDVTTESRTHIRRLLLATDGQLYTHQTMPLLPRQVWSVIEHQPCSNG